MSNGGGIEQKLLFFCKFWLLKVILKMFSYLVKSKCDCFAIWNIKMGS